MSNSISIEDFRKMKNQLTGRSLERADGRAPYRWQLSSGSVQVLAKDGAILEVWHPRSFESATGINPYLTGTSAQGLL